MPFGVAPFVGLDSLVSRRLQRQRDSGIQDIATPPFIPDVNLPQGFPTLGQTEAQSQTNEARPRSFLSRLGQRLTSEEGLAALTSGLQAGSQGRGGLESLLLGFTGGLQGRYGQRAEQEKAQAQVEKDALTRALEERRVAADESRAESDRIRAMREPTAASTREGESAKLAAELTFLKSLPGITDDQILAHFLAASRRGQAGGGPARQTDLDKIAQGLVSTGRAKDLNTAYVMARTLSQQPQFVGSIVKHVIDPKSIDGFREVRVNVSRVLDPSSGDYRIIDSFGNELTPQEMAQIQTDTSGYGNDAPAPPTPKVPDHQQPAGGGIRAFIRPSH